jgi:Protein of unknown function (DUF1236)
MRVRFIVALLAAAAMTPMAAQAQHATGDAAAGAAAGAAVGGPVGAAVGAAVGGTVGAAGDVADAVLAPPPPPVITYVEREDVPSVAIQEEVVVGRPLPRTVVVHPVPKYHYAYAVVNHRRVIVDPRTHTVVKIIER